MRKLVSGATRTASQERIMKMQGRVSPLAKSERRHEAKEKALKKAKGFKPPYPYEKSSEGKVYRHPKE